VLGRPVEGGTQVQGGQPHPARLTQPLGKGLGLMEDIKNATQRAKRPERVPKVESEVDRPRELLAAVGKVLQGYQSVLNAGDRLALSRTTHRKRGGPAEVSDGLNPTLAADSVIGEPINLLERAVACRRFQDLEDSSVQNAPLVLQQAAVGHFVRERVLERIFELTTKTRLVEELGRLEVRQPPVQAVPWQIRDGLQECERHVLADDRAALEQVFLFRRKAIHAGGQNRLDRRRHPRDLEGTLQAIRTPLADQGLRLDECLDALLNEERIPFGQLDQGTRHWAEARIIPEERPQQLVGVLRGQWVEPQLAVVGLAAPRVLVIRPIVHEEKSPSGGETLDEPVEQRLGLGIDPVKILEDDEDRLDLTLAEEKAPDRVQGQMPLLRRIQGLPTGIPEGDAQEPEKGRDGGLKRPVQREQLADDLFRDPPMVIRILDSEIGSEQADDRQIGGRHAIGHGTSLEHQPSVGSVRVGDFPDQARLPDSRFSDQADYLAMAGDSAA
jgi:hypothetical protein